MVDRELPFMFDTIEINEQYYTALATNLSHMKSLLIPSDSANEIKRGHRVRISAKGNKEQYIEGHVVTKKKFGQALCALTLTDDAQEIKL